MSRVCRNKKQVRNNGAVHSCCVQKVSFLEEVTKLQSFGQFEEKIQKKKERKETASRSFLYSASCYEKIDISHISVKLHNETMHTAAKCLTKAKWINSGGTAQHKSNSHRRGK